MVPQASPPIQERMAEKVGVAVEQSAVLTLNPDQVLLKSHSF